MVARFARNCLIRPRLIAGVMPPMGVPGAGRPAWVVTRERGSGIFRNMPRSRSLLMSDATAKERALRALEQLPEDATLEDAMERLFLLEKIERGRADMREGRSVAHEDVVERFGLR